MVHPFSSLLCSNNGQYVNEDHTEALFNQQPGVDVLQVECDIFADGSAMTGIPQDGDFEAGHAAMTIMANWWGAQLKASDIGMENVGVGPIPVGEDGSSIAVQYEWLWAVNNCDQEWRSRLELPDLVEQPGLAKGLRPRWAIS